MLTVLIPVALLFIIILIPSIPKIGGEVRLGLLIAGITAALLGGLGIGEFIGAAVFGIDKIAWVIALSVFGSIYAESQVKLGTMDTVLNTFRALFGKSPKGLIAAVILTLVLAGSLLGDAIAAATVIGVLVVLALHELKLNGEQIGVIILMGAILGSIMPPITQALFLSASLVGVKPVDPLINIGYFTVGLGVIVAIITAARFVKIKELPSELMPKETAGQILTRRWYTLVPLFILVAIVVLASGFKYNIFEQWSFFVALNTPLKKIPIIQGITFRVVEAIIVVTIISFFFSNVRRASVGVLKGGAFRK